MGVFYPKSFTHYYYLLTAGFFTFGSFICKKSKQYYLYGMHFKFFLLLILFPLLGYNQPSVQWRKTIKNGVQSVNSAVAIAADRSGHIFISGTTNEPDSGKKMLLVKLDTSGHELWRRLFTPENRKDAVSIALAVDAAGNSVHTGTFRNESGNTDIVTQKYGHDGILLWQKFYGGKANLFDAPAAVAIDKKGNVIVCGYETVSEANPDLLVMRYNASGERTFLQHYSTPKMDNAVDLVVDDSCNIYVAGNSEVSTRSADILVLKFDSVGNQKWKFLYDGVQHAVDLVSDISFDDSTSIYITGSVNRANDKADVPILRINKNGKLVCEQLISEGVSDGNGTHIVSAGKTVQLQASFTDYLQQTVTNTIHVADKTCRIKSSIKPSSADVTFLKSAGLNQNGSVLFGTILSRPENTVAPYMEAVDSLSKSQFALQDSVLISLLRIKDVLLTGRDIYFLGDDATNHAGTLSVVKYSFPEEPKKKPKVLPNQKPK